ncbi:MAG: EF-hand domain-containing protein [Caldimonas sp.]
MNASPRNWARRSAVWVLAAAASAGVFAQPADPGRGRQMAAELKKRFIAADANHDGLLSREEAKAGMPFVHRHFDEIDTARTGGLSMAEIAAYFREKAAARRSAG